MRDDLARVAVARLALASILLVPIVAPPPAAAAVTGHGDPTSRFLRLSAAEASAFRASGVTARRVLDYGAFLWLELSPAELAALRGTGIAAERPEECFVLRLGEVSFDPLAGAPGLPEGWNAAPGGAGFSLVQLLGPTRAEWLARLEAAGLKVVQYIHPFAYLVWGDLATAEVPEAREFVRWAGPFAPAFRVLPRWRGLPPKALQVDALVYRPAGTDAAVARLGALGAADLGRARVDQRYDHLSFSIPGDRLRDAAQIPAVLTLQPVPTDGGLRGEMSDQVNVGNVDGTNLAFPGYPAWLAGVGLSGAGVRIANVDGGVQETHPDLVGRFVACAGTTCSATSSSHGTHTAGIMAADGASGTLDAFGFLRGLGVAPGAELVEQVYSPHYLAPGGMLLLMKDSFANGAELSGNSWGPSGSPLGYDDDTMQVDIGVRDTDAMTAGDQPLSFVLSFMNGNGGTSTQGTPDEGKNIFTLGSTKMQNSNGSQILAIDDLSSNTAHGPALDGRTIPHLVAPGCRVDSTVTGSSYGLLCGTSMASPHTSGAVALFVESYRGLTGGADPSPALVKAAFLPAARDLAGHLDADGGTLGHPFDSKQGWGRMDLAAVVDPAVEVAYFDNPQVLDNTGEQWSASLSAADAGQPVRMMLVWTDAPGHGLGGSTPAWNNDLDLTVEVGADTFLGNQFGPDGMSQTGGAADVKNNTEGVFLPAGTGSFTVRVTAANLGSDGLPNQGDSTDQDFALACYNCLASPPIFADGFESGDVSAWSIVVP